MKCIDSKKAFSLVELSIVMVIMGLLVAATMAGTELLNISKLKSVISEAESYKVAVDNFKTQYEALPGDMSNALSFWPACGGGTAATCNGDGDGQIGSAVSTGAPFSGIPLETYFFWNHLTLSQFVPGTFSGTSTDVATLGVNVPASKHLDNIGFSVNYHSAPFSYTDALGRKFPANYITIGKTASTANYLSGNALKPVDAQYIDSKIDDGTPKFGKVLSGDGPTYAEGGCASGAYNNSTYTNTTTTEACIVSISLD